MRGLVLLFTILIQTSFLYAICDENQIDINSASLEELDGLIGIGPVKAEAISDSRPFDSVDDLINVYGIGEVTLQKIKNQGLACVENEEDVVKENKTEEEKEKEVIKNNSDNLKETTTELETKEIMLSSIVLNPKDIKTENEREERGSKYTIYGLSLFCLLLAFLFIFKKIIQKKNKNEFK